MKIEPIRFCPKCGQSWWGGDVCPLHAEPSRNTGFDLADDTKERAGRVHDWRNHVPSDVWVLWPQATSEQRWLVALVAQYAADKEDWE